VRVVAGDVDLVELTDLVIHGGFNLGVDVAMAGLAVLSGRLTL
jgi:hypothetical protein